MNKKTSFSDDLLLAMRTLRTMFVIAASPFALISIAAMILTESFMLLIPGLALSLIIAGVALARSNSEVASRAHNIMTSSMWVLAVIVLIIYGAAGVVVSLLYFLFHNTPPGAFS